MRNVFLILLALNLSGCAYGLVADEILTNGRISSAVNDSLDYNKNLNMLLPSCLKNGNTTTAYCEKMSMQFKKDRPSWKVIEATLLCAKKDGYEQFDWCYEMAKRNF